MEKYAIGIDIGGTNTRGGLVSRSGKSILFSKTKTDDQANGEKLSSDIIKFINEMLTKCKKQRKKISAIGLGVPGPIDHERGTILSAPNLPNVKNLPLEKVIEDAIDIPAFIENDANAVGVGEHWLGAGMDFRSILLLTLGTGIGGAIIIDDRLVRGATGSAGELGHVIIKFNGLKCGCGNRGCLEAYTSTRRIVAQMKRKLGAEGEKIFKDKKITPKGIYKLAVKGDNRARAVLEEMGTYLGIGITTIINIFDPQAIILSGGISGAFRFIKSVIKTEIKNRAVSSAAKNVKILKTKLGDTAGILGAAKCAFQRNATLRG